MSHSRGISLMVNPALRPGLDALSWWLEDNHYSQHAREAILAHTAAEGTPTGSVYLEAEDEAEATEAFVSALPAVSMDDAAWDRPDVFLDAQMLADGTHPFPFGDEPDDDADRSIPPGAVLIPPELEPDAPDADPMIRFPGIAPLFERMPPVSGGSPEGDEAFAPSPEDWAEYRRWSEDLDRRREMAEWYRRNPLEGLNRDRLD